MNSIEFGIDFKVNYKPIVLGSSMDRDLYEKLWDESDWDTDALRHEISDYYECHNEFESDIKKLISFTQDADPNMHVYCDASIDEADGYIHLRFDNVSDVELVRLPIDKIETFLEDYSIDVELTFEPGKSGYESVNVLVAATGASKEFLKLDEMFDEFFDTYQEYAGNLDIYDFYDNEQIGANKDKYINKINEFDVSDEKKEELRHQYEEFFTLIAKAQAMFPGLAYQENGDTFMAPANTVLRVFLEDIEIGEN